MSSGLAFERAAMPCDEPSPMVAVRVACVQNERKGILGESHEKGEASWVERTKAERGAEPSLWAPELPRVGRVPCVDNLVPVFLPSPTLQTFPPLSPCTPRPSTERHMEK